MLLSSHPWGELGSIPSRMLLDSHPCTGRRPGSGHRWAGAADGSGRPGDADGVAAGGDDLLAPGVEQGEEAIRVVAERIDDAPFHVVGGDLDLLAEQPS